MIHTKYKTKVNFYLKPKYEGVYDDGISKKFKPLIYIKFEPLQPLKHEIQELHQLFNKHDVRINYKQEIESINTYFTIIRIFQENDWTIGEKVPYSIWKTVVDNEDKPVIPRDLIIQKIGQAIWDQLCPFQQTTVERAIRYQKGFLALSMGCGKSFCSLAVCKYFQELWPVLIICPSSLKYTFQSEILKWFPDIDKDSIFIAKDSKQFEKKLVKAKEKNEEINFVIISYSLVSRPIVHKYLKENQFKIVIMDESHYVKNIQSKRSNFCLDISKKADICLLLSGTPFNYSSELYQQIKILYPDMYPYFFNYHYGNEEDPDTTRFYFANRYCKPVKVRQRGRDVWTFKGFERSDELNAILNTFMIRLRKKDVLPQLPEKIRICITLDPLSKGQEKEIAKYLDDPKKEKSKKRSIDNSKEKSIEKKGKKRRRIGGNRTGGNNEDFEELENESDQDEKGKDEDIKKENKERYMKAFRLTCQYKIESVKNFIREQIIENILMNNEQEKVIIFHHHVVMGEMIKECLNDHNISFFRINQETSSESRHKYQEEFQSSDKYQVALLSIMAASTGLTLTAASTVVFTEILFGPDLHTQAEDRAHRIGQKNQVNIVYLIQPNSTDLINFNLIKKKERESTQILDGKANHLESTTFSLTSNSNSNSNSSSSNSSSSISNLNSSIPNSNNSNFNFDEKGDNLSTLSDIIKHCGEKRKISTQNDLNMNNSNNQTSNGNNENKFKTLHIIKKPRKTIGML